MKSKESSDRYISTFLSAIRIAIGWHFLYEGVAKIIAGNCEFCQLTLQDPNGSLLNFHWMAGSAGIISCRRFH